MRTERLQLAADSTAETTAESTEGSSTDVGLAQPGTVVAIGVFDGVHRGHQALLSQAVAIADFENLESVCLTFDPNPVEVIRPDLPIGRLATLPHRAKLLGDLGLDRTAILPFDAQAQQLSAEDFVRDVLVGQLRARVVVVGENFRFGHRATGDVSLLESIAEESGFRVHTQPLLGDSDLPVSSTRIRAAVESGSVRQAAAMLGRAHRVEGTVVAGYGRGRELGFPTANLATTERAVVPADGVYAGWLAVDPYEPGERDAYAVAISVGTNPTFGSSSARTVEAWAFDSGTSIDLYDKHVAVDFVAHIRHQETFDSHGGLIAAVQADAVAARVVLGRS